MGSLRDVSPSQGFLQSAKSNSQTEEAPERAKHLSNFPYSSWRLQSAKSQSEEAPVFIFPSPYSSLGGHFLVFDSQRHVLSYFSSLPSVLALGPTVILSQSWS